MNNPLISPAFGLIFWTVITFFILLFLLKKFAWKPILKAVNERSDKIDKALQNAEIARKNLENLKSENIELLKKSRLEREKIINEADKMKNEIIEKAKLNAKKEESKIITNAREAIEKEKIAAITEIKSTVGIIAIEIAEKLIKKELEKDTEQQEIINNHLKKIELN